MIDDSEELAALLQAAKSRDTQAFNKLWATLRDTIRDRAAASIQGKLARRVDASDVTQDASLTIWEKLPQFEGESIAEFIAWCLKVLRSERTREVEWHGAGKRSVTRDDGPPAGGDGQPTWGAVSDPHAETPSAIVGHDDEYRRIAGAIGRIPSPRQREAVRLKYLERLSGQQIADTMKLSRPTVAGLVARGTEVLRELLEPRETE